LENCLADLEGPAMNHDRRPLDAREPSQFSLAALLEYVTVCGVLLAFCAIAGIACVAFLMAMAGALAARQGWLALASLAGALSAADWKFASTDPDASYGRELLAILLAALLCIWYLRRVKASRLSGPARTDSRSCGESIESAGLDGVEHCALRVGGKAPLQPADQRKPDLGVPVTRPRDRGQFIPHAVIVRPRDAEPLLAALGVVPKRAVGKGELPR
jgi:hypothetical protein